MIVNYLELDGFLGYRRRCALDLSGKRTVGICGVNEAGKSTVLRAICYALHGQVPTPHGEVRELQLVNDDSRGLLVKVDVGKICIERGRTRKNEPVLRASGISSAAKPSQVQEHIRDTLELNYNDFVALSYFVQGDIHQFLSGNKRAYFQRWTSGLRLWKALEERAQSGERAASGRAAETERELARAQRVIDAAGDTRATVRAAKSAVAEARRQAALVSEQVRRLQVELGSQRKLEDLREALDSLRDERRRMEHDAQDLGYRAGALRQQLQNVRTGRCPLLDIDCGELEELGHEQRKRLNGEARECDAKREKLEGRGKALERRIKSMKSRLTDAPVSKLRQDLKDLRADLLRANRDLQDEMGELARAEAAHEALGRARAEVRRLSSLSATRAEELRRLQFLRFMCGRSGVPAEVIEVELARVEERCNWVLGRLDYPKRIKFAGYKELASFERVCPCCGSERWRDGKCRGCGAARPRKRKDEPTVTILDGAHERAFALESGGAQTLQSFAVRLACSLFVSSMTGAPLDLVMLDEVFAHLDASNRQKLMNLVVDKLGSVFGLKQQFVVSHHEDVVNVVDDMLVVRRERGSSVARWA